MARALAPMPIDNTPDLYRADLRRVDVRQCERVVFVGGAPAAPVIAATLARAMAPTSVAVVATSSAGRCDGSALTSSLASVGLQPPASLLPWSKMVFHPHDIVVTIDCDRDIPATVAAALVVGDALDLSAPLGHPPRGPLLAPGDDGATNLDTRLKFVIGLLRGYCQSLFLRSELMRDDDDVAL